MKPSLLCCRPLATFLQHFQFIQNDIRQIFFTKIIIRHLFLSKYDQIALLNFAPSAPVPLISFPDFRIFNLFSSFKFVHFLSPSPTSSYQLSCCHGSASLPQSLYGPLGHAPSKLNILIQNWELGSSSIFF